MPGDQEPGEQRYYIRIDRVNYDDKAPWPVEADGNGEFLKRLYNTLYGNDVINWMKDVDGDGIPNETDPDNDNDGIANDWELAHGLNPLFDDAAMDFDSDSFDNIYEYVTDTDPQDANSKQYFLIDFNSNGLDLTTRFNSSSQREYIVEYCNTLNPTNSWKNLLPPFLGSGSEMLIPDSTTNTHRFYRLRIQLP